MDAQFGMPDDGAPSPGPPVGRFFDDARNDTEGPGNVRGSAEGPLEMPSSGNQGDLKLEDAWVVQRGDGDFDNGRPVGSPEGGRVGVLEARARMAPRLPMRRRG